MRAAKTLVTTLLAVALAGVAAQARDSVNDYAFEPVNVDVKSGAGSELAVRVTHKPTGNPVEGIVLVHTRLDMSPDGMEMMTAKPIPRPSTEPGLYRFRTDLTMSGGWALKLVAKLPGEAETVERTIVFKAK
ncbi:MAG: FixH family protein [Hyphomicrobiaceae bacterium]